jgi:hypothetical protein
MGAAARQRWIMRSCSYLLPRASAHGHVVPRFQLVSEDQEMVSQKQSYSCIGFVADRFMISVPGSAVSVFLLMLGWFHVGWRGKKAALPR